MNLREKQYFIYPDKQIISCIGLSPAGERKGWRFQPGKDSPMGDEIRNFNNQEEAFATIKLVAESRGIGLPERFGEISIKDFKGLNVKKNSVSTRTAYVDESGFLHQPIITFQFNPDSIYSFTSAIKNAYKVKKIVASLKHQIKQIKPVEWY